MRFVVSPFFSHWSWKVTGGQGCSVHFPTQLIVAQSSWPPALMLGGHFILLFDSNSPKVANTNKHKTGIVQCVSKQCESPPRHSSIFHHPQSPGWCLIIIWDWGAGKFIAEHLSVSGNPSPRPVFLLPAHAAAPPPPIYHQRPPPIGAETGVLSPSHSTSTANLPGRWRLECDKSICPGLNLYANLK